MNKIILFLFLPTFIFSQKNEYIFKGGVQITSDGSKELWATVGTDIYFLYELGYNFPKDITHLRSGFDYASTKIWGHERLDDIVRRVYWSGGIGTRINKVDIHFSFGLTKIDYFYHFYDDSLFASPNGHYSFKRFTDGEISGKFGLIYDISLLSLKIDYDFLYERATFGLGINFRKKN